MTPDSPKGPESEARPEEASLGTRIAQALHNYKPLPMTVDRLDSLHASFYADVVMTVVTPDLTDLAFDRDAAQATADLLVQQLEDLRDDVLGDESLLVPEIVGAAARTVERLTAEVERLRRQAALHRLDLDRIGEGLGLRHGQTVDRLVRWTEIHRDTGRALEGERDEWKRAAETEAALLDQEQAERQAEVSRLREQLAAQTEQVERTRRAERRSIASVLTGMLEELEAAYVHEVGAGPAQTLDKLRAAQAFSIDLFATSGPVELDEFTPGVSSSEVEAPQPMRHEVYYWQGERRWEARCGHPDCGQGASGSEVHVHWWKDQHEADTLRPTAVDGKPVEQKIMAALLEACRVRDESMEGRPSGSERLAPRSGVELITDERARQVAVEGWTPDHDAKHDNDDLARAAVCYALPRRWRDPLFAEAPCPPKLWPWDAHYWKPIPADRVRELVKAGALIAAEIDRIQRMDAAQAARSEATPKPVRDLTSNCHRWRCGHTYNWHASTNACVWSGCGCVAFVDEPVPSPSLRKEGEDSD